MHKNKNHEYTKEREESYEKAVRGNAFDHKLKIIVQDGSAYLADNSDCTFLCTPLNPKHFWYEVYLAFETVYGPSTIINFKASKRRIAKKVMP